MGFFLSFPIVPVHTVGSAGKLEFISDTISSSAPSLGVNHSIGFTLATNIPASGTIIIDFPTGFNIPVGFTIADTEFLLNNVSQSLAATPSGSTLGVTIVSGNSGSVTFQLGTSGFVAGDNIIVRFNSNKITNSAIAGTHNINVQTKNGITILDDSNAMVVVISPVNVTASTVPVVEETPEVNSSSGSYLTGQLAISGRASPFSIILILKDGRIVSFTVADSAANFQVTLSRLTVGRYNISLYSEDRRGSRSNAESFAIVVTAGTTINIGNIFLSPSIEIDKTQVKAGESLNVFGQTIRDGQVMLNLDSKESYATTTSDQSGVYLYNLNTEALALGTHTIKSQSKYNQEVSGYSRELRFTIGDINLDESVCKRGDLNNDSKVNEIDFFIAKLWYQKSLSGVMTAKEKCSLNNDTKIDLVDFSIIAYFWTG